MKNDCPTTATILQFKPRPANLVHDFLYRITGDQDEAEALRERLEPSACYAVQRINEIIKEALENQTKKK